MMKLLKLAVLVVLIALFVGPLARALLNNQSPPSKPATAQPESKKKNLVNQELLAELRPIIPKCKDALTRYRASGIVGDVEKTSYGAVFVEFDERVWNEAISRQWTNRLQSPRDILFGQLR